jgi:hypothetical protein
LKLNKIRKLEKLQLQMEKQNSILNILTLINELKNNCDNGLGIIKEHFMTQKKLVQQTAENKIKEINISSETLIQKLDDYEDECIQSYLSKYDFKYKINELINEANEFIIDQNNLLKQTELFDQEARELNAKLNQEIKKTKVLTFDNKLIKFYSNEIDFLDESVLGKIEIQSMEFEQNVNIQYFFMKNLKDSKSKNLQ